jgi:protein-S-isoprenylcysteine O-methyltransferase Ste14
MEMLYVAAAALGHLIIQLSDVAAIKRLPVVKPVSWAVGSGLWLYSMLVCSLWPQRLPLPSWTTVAGWALLAPSALVLSSSLFISLPFRKTYITSGTAGTTNSLVTSGLYSLVRHPWIYGYAPLMLSILLVSKSTLMLIAAPLLTSLTIITAIIQDKYIFNRLFPGYEDYRRTTPMLFPNRDSVRLFISSLRQARA